jgi:GrpB-like predicted nucleotidyltransferase (UPF0157 family)
MKTLKQRVQRAIQEDVVIVRYDSRWPELFRQEAAHLLACLPEGLVRRIEHFGSTAVPGLPAKPVIDMLVEVSTLRAARTEIAPVLQSDGYDYFWRPTFGDDVPPWYAFFIKRAKSGVRTHHIHMITRRRAFQGHWDRLLFRDYLIADVALYTIPRIRARVVCRRTISDETSTFVLFRATLSTRAKTKRRSEMQPLTPC